MAEVSPSKCKKILGARLRKKAALSKKFENRYKHYPLTPVSLVLVLLYVIAQCIVFTAIIKTTEIFKLW